MISNKRNNLKEFLKFNISKNKKILIVFLLLLIWIISNYSLKLYFKDHEKLKKTIFQFQSQNHSSIITSFINEPILPLKNEEYIKRGFSKTYYDSKNIRFHFEDLFKTRRLYKINYSYLPYEKSRQFDSYDNAADFLFESTGILNLTLLNYYYNNTDKDKSKLNHIHLAMSFDNKYIILSKISIASILNTTSPNTFIHLHIGLNNCTYYDIKTLIDLTTINNNIEFIFYKGIQAEYDFNKSASKGFRGIGEYTRILLPQIVNNTNRILILDSGDIIALKDLSELYFFDIEDNYFVFSLECTAGSFNRYYIFSRNNFYPNAGICLVNVRKFRKDNLYRSAFFSSIAYNHLPCPFQDIFLMISNYKFKFWPLNYNAPQFFFNDDQIKKKTYNISTFRNWLDWTKNSPFKYYKEELMNAALNPVILHLYNNKPYLNAANKRYKNMWLEYSKLAKVYDKIKIKYPKLFINKK